MNNSKWMVVFALVGLSAGFVAGCGPDWGDCKSCSMTSPTQVESSDNDDKVDVDVNVTVVVNTDTEENPCPVCADAGTHVDAGTPDCGTPPNKPDAGCKKVCATYKKAWKCGGKNYGHKSCDKHCEPVNKCVKEVVKCG